MTTERKIEANRKNSKLSTGPRTTRGRAHVSRNALRHGLAISIASDPELSAEAECLARVILGDDISPSRQHYARIAAQAEIDMRRIRRVRTQLIAMSLDRSENPDESASQDISEVLPQLINTDRYERRAWSRRKRAYRDLNSV
jgi:hypothetical protein